MAVKTGRRDCAAATALRGMGPGVPRVGTPSIPTHGARWGSTALGSAIAKQTDTEADR